MERKGQPLIGFNMPGWAPPAALQTEPGDARLRKTNPDSILRTGLAEWLAGHGVQHLVICGHSTEYCVDTSTRRRAGLGFSVTLVADAHTSHDKPHASGAQIRACHNATLPNLTSFGVVKAAGAQRSDRFRSRRGCRCRCRSGLIYQPRRDKARVCRGPCHD